MDCWMNGYAAAPFSPIHSSNNPTMHLSPLPPFGVIACVEAIRGELKVSGILRRQTGRSVLPLKSKQRGECYEENYFGCRSSGEFDFGGLE